MTDQRLETRARVEIGPVKFTPGRFSDAVDGVLAGARLQRDRGLAIHFANAYTVALADQDASYARLLNAGVCLPDGVPVLWFGRRRAASATWERVYGPDLMAAVLGASGRGGPRHYLLGSTPETLALLAGTIERRWPDAVVVGTESPPFRELSGSERTDQLARIRESEASVVWVGLGTPKQDHEVNWLAKELPLTAIAVGAAFDFMAGTKPQAPGWMQRSGLEWSYRLGTEPKRLWHRYLWGNPRFVVAVSRRGR